MDQLDRPIHVYVRVNCVRKSDIYEENLHLINSKFIQPCKTRAYGQGQHEDSKENVDLRVVRPQRMVLTKESLGTIINTTRNKL